MVEQYENVFTTGEWGADLWARLYNPETKKSRYQKFPNTKYVPPIYFPNKPTLNAISEYSAFDDGKPLYKVTYPDMFKYKNALKETNKEKAYGLQERRFHYIRETFKNPEDSNHKIRTQFIDIEVEVTEKGFPKPENAREMVTIIQLYDTFTEEFYILGNRKWTGAYKSRFGSVKYIQFNNEIDLLEAYIKITQKTNPGIITGFNSNPFDMPYLINRMKNLNIDYTKLSPVGEIKWKDSVTQDSFSYKEVIIKGRLLADYRNLIIKYAYLDTPSFSLENVAVAYDLKGKSKPKSYSYQSFNGNYSGQGYIELIHDEKDVPPDEIEVWKLQKENPNYKGGNKELDQAVFNAFMKYAIRDVEVMLEIDEKAKLINLAQTVAYMSGVTIDDVQGTLKFWLASMYNTTYKDNVILPMKQQFTEDCTYVAGWVRSIPGKYKWVTSFDIGSAHPHEHVNHNIGADSLILPKDLPQELIELRDKYFNFFDPSTFPDVVKDKKEPNDIQEETNYYIFLLNNADKIRPVLEKYNVIATVNGYFHDKSKECYASKEMRKGLTLRMKYKKEGKSLRAKIEELKKNNGSKDEIKVLIEKAEYAESMSLALKIRINAYYGANTLLSNPYSNGRLSGASVAMSTRAVNKISAIAVDRVVNKFLGLPQDDTLSTIKVCDTDSIYCTLEKLVEKVQPKDPVVFCKNFSEKVLLPEILKLEKIFLDGLNVVDASLMKFDNEIIAEGLLTIAPKRYFAKVKVVDGIILNETKDKATGISLISRSTPQAVKSILKPTLGIFINEDEKHLQKYMSEKLKEFIKLKPGEISGVVGVNSLDYEPYFENTKVKTWKQANKFKHFNGERDLTAPINSKGSIVHNFLIDEYNLAGKYEKIDEANKVNVIYLKIPNPITFNHNVIAFKDENILNDLKILGYIDVEKQWDKEVISKVEIIARAVKWSVIKQNENIEEW